MDLTTAEARMQHLLNQIGTHSRCQSCQAPIVFVLHRNGKVTPYNYPNGTPHFSTCPQADSFRKNSRQKSLLDIESTV